MALPRTSGVLLHPTSLPGPHGSGDLGADAEKFLAWLEKAGQRTWQVLPLAPVGYGNSPYSALSAFAVNPGLISLDALVRKGWLAAGEVPATTDLPTRSVDFGRVPAFRWARVAKAAERFFEAGSAADRASFDAFRGRHAAWLDDYALFMALNDHAGGREWTTWAPDLARRDPQALKAAREALAGGVRAHAFSQWAAFEQWQHLRRVAHARGIQLVGDMPIFVAHQSADVWARPDLFTLDEHRRPTVVAGVPPDYFSATGQRWGNPLYRWDRMAQDGYRWWIARVKALLELVDVVRIDHFRGFAGYWEIPASEETAVKGRWVPGPGAKLFDALRGAIGHLPIIAEDLGVITPDVAQLRDRYAFPGMKVLQFAFGGDASNAFLPHAHVANAVVYTGTHDNDTTRGWFDTAPESERHYARRYLGTSGHDVAWDFIRLANASVADTCLFPFQDVLGLGSDARMNRPGVADGNWEWRFTWDEVPLDADARLAELARLFGRARTRTAGDAKTP